jgi:hypothetical protein
MMYLLNDSISEEEARRVIAYVLRRAETDPSFRSALLSTPKEALEAEFAIDLPDSFNIRFVENNGADLTVVLPDVASERPPAGTSGPRGGSRSPSENGLSGDRLSGDDLTAVSGGSEHPNNVEAVLRTLGTTGLTQDSDPHG